MAVTSQATYSNSMIVACSRSNYNCTRSTRSTRSALPRDFRMDGARNTGSYPLRLNTSFSIERLLGPTRKPTSYEDQMTVYPAQSHQGQGSSRVYPQTQGQNSNAKQQACRVACLPTAATVCTTITHQERCRQNIVLQQDSHRERSRRERDPTKKRIRTAFTTHQIRELESEFQKNKYLTITRRSELAKSLELSDTQIKIWFQNRRTKLKRKVASEMAFSLSPSPAGHYYPCHPAALETFHRLRHVPTCADSVPCSCWHTAGSLGYRPIPLYQQ